jgi:hypothetical protein
MAADRCLTCRAPLERPARPAAGRPPRYCSTACRRAAEYELRRLQRFLERLELRAAIARAEDDYWLAPRYRREVRKAERRLLELLAAQDDQAQTGG